MENEFLNIEEQRLKEFATYMTKLYYPMRSSPTIVFDVREDSPGAVASFMFRVRENILELYESFDGRFFRINPEELDKEEAGKLVKELFNYIRSFIKYEVFEHVIRNMFNDSTKDTYVIFEFFQSLFLLYFPLNIQPAMYWIKNDGNTEYKYYLETKNGKLIFEVEHNGAKNEHYLDLMDLPELLMVFDKLQEKLEEALAKKEVDKE